MLLWRSLPLVTFLLVAQLNFALLPASYAARGRMKLQAAYSASNNADTGCPTAENTLLMRSWEIATNTTRASERLLDTLSLPPQRFVTAGHATTADHANANHATGGFRFR
jgi:hypothetical protein